MSKEISENTQDNHSQDFLDDQDYDIDYILESDARVSELFANAMKGDFAELKVEILKGVLDDFLSRNQLDIKELLDAFKSSFLNFDILHFYQAEEIAQLNIRLFSYVSSAYDPFSPDSSVHHELLDIIKKVVSSRTGKKSDITITYQING